MRPIKLFQFVNVAESPKQVGLRKFDDAVRSSTFKLPAYLNRVFPLYRELKDWPGATSDGDKNELVYRVGEGARGEIRFDTKCNLAIRMELSDRDVLPLKVLLEEMLAFRVFFNRVIVAYGNKGDFQFTAALEGMHAIPIFYNELTVEGGWENFANWSLPEGEMIEATSEVFSFPGSDILVHNSVELNVISEMLIELAFNIVGTRFDPLRGPSPDRLRLDRNGVTRVAAELSQSIYSNLPDHPNDSVSARKVRKSSE